MNSKRIGIVGCGAVSEKFHLPALDRHDGFEVVHLVDKCLERAKELATKHSIPSWSTDISDLSTCDGVILAVPHFLHCPMALELISKGVPVLVEKPMAISASECDAMLERSLSSGASICVGQMRRYNPSISVVKEYLDRDILGEIQRVDIREGGPVLLAGGE